MGDLWGTGCRGHNSNGEKALDTLPVSRGPSRVVPIRGKGLEDQFVTGINYWPREKAMAWWREFEASTVERDVSLLADYGFDVIRIFLLWEDFQPGMTEVSVPSLDHLVQVAEVASNCKVQILPTFFTGHMSGVNWLPPWMLESGKGDERFPVFSQGNVQKASIRNCYSERDIWKAQRLLIREVSIWWTSLSVRSHSSS